MHDHDEFLQADVYFNGIEVHKKIIRNLADDISSQLKGIVI